MIRKPDWLKSKGYLHITPSLSMETNWKSYYHRIKSPTYIANYAFFPLLHRIITDRKFKKPNLKKHIGTKRSHKHRTLEDNSVEKSVKKRPLHYASHFDSLIYSYYAEILGNLYDNELKKDNKLDKSVLAYRRIAISETNNRGKSNIHFANEVFQEINKRVDLNGDTSVLAIDLKSFFSSLAHDTLYNAWASLLGKDSLPPDHNNVFKACTNFSYILFDDLKSRYTNKFNESKLAKIRRDRGYKSFFESNEDFRKEIKNGKVPIYKNPFRGTEETTGKKILKGIPQGLPISAVLANLYLLNFDKSIIDELVVKLDVDYRRYSDDILLVCKPTEVKQINDFINNLILEYKIEISKDKTEQFLFKKVVFNNAGDRRTSVFKISDGKEISGSPLNYLGFEFRGYNTLIKSANLAKYYRRIIQMVKRRAKRAIYLSQHNPAVSRAIYINQIKKLYNSPLKYSNKTEVKQIFRKRHSLKIDDRGDYTFNHFDVEVKNYSNYISYITRCKKEFITNTFSMQLRKKRQIIGQAINKYLVNKK